MKTQLLSLSLDELKAYMKEIGESAFRGKQEYEWLMRGADFS